MSKAIEPVEQKQIVFNGDELIAVRAGDGMVYVPIRPICEQLGLNWPSQSKRIKRDDILSEAAQGVAIMTTPSTDGRGGGQQTLTCLPIQYLNGWLFGLSTNKVRSELRDSLQTYKRDCYTVLAEAFGRNMVTAKPSAIDTSDSPAALAYRNALALVNMARQQFELEQRIDSAETRIDAIEATLSNPAHLITNEQAQRISHAVKTIAYKLGERSGRNEYGGVYSELHRRFEVPGYKELPAAKFQECMSWLRQWWENLTDGADVEF